MNETTAIVENALLREILDASPTFLHVLRGPSFIFEYANDAYYRLVGRRDLIGRPAFEAMPEAAGSYPERIASVMKTRQPFHGRELPVMLARAPGLEAEERLIDLVYLPLIDADGICTRVLGHGTDVTENVLLRRRAENAERLSFAKLTNALSAGRMIAWEWDVQTDAITSSGAWLELFDSTIELFDTGQAALKFLHPDDRDARKATVKAALADDLPWHIEYRALHPNGDVVWLEERATLLRDANTDHQLVVGLVWDISTRKRAEEALRLADIRKNDFLATLSHELRNPLAPIRSGLQILKHLVHGNERLDRTRQIMERQMTHLVRLIDDLMEVSRISRGKVALRSERLLLGSVLSVAVEEVWPAMDTKSLQLVQGPNDTLVVEGDKDRLAQVFANLLNNAAKFSETASTITLTMHREGNDAVVVVADEGQGIDAKSLETVFDLFAQGPSHQMSGSLGIGLALIRQLVNLHNGSVQVQSEGPNRGSTFTVRLPLATTDISAPNHREDEIDDRERSAHRMRVLVVDDNQDAADTLATYLELEGHPVDVAYGGMQATDVFEKILPEVVLLDIGMPEIDGYEVARRIRRSASGKVTKLVALTGWGQTEDKARALEAGFDEHLTKPVDLKTLSSILKVGASSI
ncbi:MAG: hybrid sensor histidine kinase/response regulator [Janthinobacterium lividum]